MSGDVHVRFCEHLGGRFPGVTRLVLVHRDAGQPAHWQTEIEGFLQTSLGLMLRDAGRLDSGYRGVDFLGHVVRPGYRLVRNRVIQHLEERLRATRKILWRNAPHGCTLDLRREPRDRLRASLESYVGHGRHAAAWRLFQRVFQRHTWLRVLFTMHDSLRLQPRWLPPAVTSLRGQWRWFVREWPGLAVLVQTGHRFELYNEQARSLARWLTVTLDPVPRQSFTATLSAPPDPAARLPPRASPTRHCPSVSGGRRILARRAEAQSTAACLVARTFATRLVTRSSRRVNMKTTRTRVRWTLAIGAALLATSATADIPSAAGACNSDLVETTPSSDFTALDGGAVVRHEPTGLEWQRCAEGMSWTGTECTGSANAWTWQGALQHADAVSGWRLPNISELRSIVERCRSNPAVNQQVFPDRPSFGFWSASPFAGLSGSAWYVFFINGSDGWSLKGNLYGVRLVRGGQ